MVFGFGSKKPVPEPTASEQKEPLTDGFSSADRDKLLANPKVKEAMRSAGDDALLDPKVQEAIKSAAQEMFKKENAERAMQAAKEWANDPEVQAKARHYAGMAMVGVDKAAQQFIGCIEQGPEGLRLLAFAASVASCVNAAFTVLNIGNIIGLQLVSYALAGYQTVFALTTMLFEAKPEWIAKVPLLSKYQDMLIEYCKFITMAVGRGVFYIFQGSLWLTTMPNLLSLDFLVGMALVFVGVLHVLMHFEIMPQHVAAKAREALDKAKATAGKGMSQKEGP